MPDATPVAPSTPVAAAPVAPGVIAPPPQAGSLAAAILDGAAAAQTPPATPPAAPPAAPDDAARFAAFARKEADLRRQQEAVATQAAEIAKAREAVQRHEAALAGAKRDPLAYLKTAGLSYDDVTRAHLAGAAPAAAPGGSDPIQAKLAELDAWKQEQEKRWEQREQERLDSERKAAVTEYTGEVATFLESGGDAYELTRLYEGGNLVVGVVQEHLARTGKLLSTKEAADLVERFYEENTRKALATKRFAANPPGGAKPSGAQPQAGAPSVTNALTASTPAVTDRVRTEEERYEAAMRILKQAG